MTEFEQAREAFRQRWGLGASLAVEDAVRRGEFDIEGGTEDERAFIRETLTMMSSERFALFPAGDCAHCGELVNENRLLEFVARDVNPDGLRPVTVLVHTISGHERCEGRDTTAERNSEPEGQR
jgi:hypothetical protein